MFLRSNSSIRRQRRWPLMLRLILTIFANSAIE
jgi:hypothetical protein